MEAFIGTIVFIIQLAVAGFVTWGGWLCFKEWFRRERADAAAGAQEAPAAKGRTPVADFERVASLVLLALLCSTLAAAA